MGPRREGGRPELRLYLKSILAASVLILSMTTSPSLAAYEIGVLETITAPPSVSVWPAIINSVLESAVYVELLKVNVNTGGGYRQWGER